MDILLKKKVDLMIENFYELKRGFKWEAHLLKHFGAMVYATKEKNIEIDTIEEVKSYIKSETSWCSQFRGMNSFIFANLLSLENDYKSFFKDMLEVYDRMKEKGFSSSQYLPLATYTIVKEVPKEHWDYSIKRMKLFYDNMRKNHFWLTSYDDYVFAAVLATTDLDADITSRKIEECYKALNESGFYKGNDLQTLSHILAIGEEGVQQKCRKAKDIYNGLANNKCKLQYSGLATLGLITLITDDTDKIVNEIKEVYDYIYSKDGYGLWSLDKTMRVILAATLVSDFYVKGIKDGILQITLGNSINAILIAQEQAAIAAACAASAAAAAASN